MAGRSDHGFLREVAELRDRLRPDVRISLAALPWRPEDHDNAVYEVVGQDFEALAEVIDVFNPMSYYLLSERPVAWIGEVNEYFARITGRPVLAFRDLSSSVTQSSWINLTAEDWDEAYTQALSGGSKGLIAFPFRVMPGELGFEVFKRRFANE